VKELSKITEQEKKILEKHLDNIRSLLDKIPNTQIEGTTEYRIIVELEKVNSEFEISYIGKYL